MGLKYLDISYKMQFFNEFEKVEINLYRNIEFLIFVCAFTNLDYVSNKV